MKTQGTYLSTRRLPFRIYLLKVPPLLNDFTDREGQAFNT